MVEIFRGDVFLSKKSVQDQFTLAGELELMLSEVLFQHPHFFCMLRHAGQCSR